MSKQDEQEFDDDVEFVEEDGEGAELAAKDKMKQLREKLKKAEAEVKENLDGWQRARADYVNLQKSFDEERTNIRRRAVEDLIQDILPTLDNFEMSMRNKEVWQSVDAKWRTGIEYIYQHLQKSLTERGVTEIADPSEAFDPQRHEPLELVDTDNPDNEGKIIEVLQKGYTYNDRILRPAKVKLYKHS